MTTTQIVGACLLAATALFLLIEWARGRRGDYTVTWTPNEDDDYLDLYDQVFALEQLNIRDDVADRAHLETRRP